MGKSKKSNDDGIVWIGKHVDDLQDIPQLKNRMSVLTYK